MSAPGRVAERVAGDGPKYERRRHPDPMGLRDVKERHEHGRRLLVGLGMPWHRNDVADLAASAFACGSRGPLASPVRA